MPPKQQMTQHIKQKQSEQCWHKSYACRTGLLVSPNYVKNLISDPICEIGPNQVRHPRTHISLGRRIWCQHGAFSGMGAFVASFVPAECPNEVGYVGYIRKAFEKGFYEMC